MSQTQNLDSTTIVLSSGLASVISTIMSNPFELIRCTVMFMNTTRDRGQNSNMFMKLPLQDSPDRYMVESSQNRGSGTIEWRVRLGEPKPQIPQLKYIKPVRASLPTRLQKPSSTFIYMKEPQHFSMDGSMLFYKQVHLITRKFLQSLELPSARLAVPLLASSLSRALTTTITFPLEYWKVLQSSSVGYSKLKNIQLGTQFHSAYLVTIQRDVLFSCIYWSLLENLKIELGARIKDYPNVVNLTSAMLASSVTATMTLPLDVVKTRKQVSTRSDLHHQQLTTMDILQSIYKEDGLKGLVKGYQPRIAKVTMHSGLVYMMYEYLKQLF